MCPDVEAEVETSATGRRYRRLALIVGVGDYGARDLHLLGPPHDAERFYALLTGPEIYGIPASNVCMLKDAEANRPAFEAAWQRQIVERAQDGDIVILYFSGHGSQSPDGNGDEFDGKDETLLFHYRTHDDDAELVDDRFNQMLQALYEAMGGEEAGPQHVALVLDSCNSGTAARDGAGVPALEEVVIRGVPAMGGTPLDTKEGIASGEGGAWEPGSLPGLVTLSAARDGSRALEQYGIGFFTEALIKGLGAPWIFEPTYGELLPSLKRGVASCSPLQIPAIGGDLSWEVFGPRHAGSLPGYRVAASYDGGHLLSLTGPPMVGWSPGAEFRIYDVQAKPVELRDPENAKGRFEVTRLDGTRLEARRLDPADADAPVGVGDLAVLLRPGRATRTLRLFPGDPRTGERLSPAFVSALDAQIARGPGGTHAQRTAPSQREPSLAPLLQLSERPEGTWTLFPEVDGHLALYDPAGERRRAFSLGPGGDLLADPGEVAQSLWQFVRHRSLLQLAGEGGDALRDDTALQVRVKPRDTASSCQKRPLVPASPWTAHQRVPLCTSYWLEVTYFAPPGSPSSGPTLHVGGLLLSPEGSTYALTEMRSGESAYLSPGQSALFGLFHQGATVPLLSLPPTQVPDHILFFGAEEGAEVDWRLLAEPMVGHAAPKAGLAQQLESFMSLDARGAAPDVAYVAPSRWTSTHITTSALASEEEATILEGLPRDRLSDICRSDLRCGAPPP